MSPMSPTLTKKQVREALGLRTDAALADWFEVSRAAVAQWTEDEPLPRLRQLEACQRRPDLFSLISGEAKTSPLDEVA